MKEKLEWTMQRLMHHYGSQQWWTGENEVEDMLAMILIQRTTERNAKLAMENLTDVLQYEKLLALSDEELQEWHAVIDEHGKAYRKTKGTLDESWLTKE